MRKLEYIIPAEYDDRKLLHFLRGSAGFSSRLIRNLKMHENGMLLNGLHVRTVDIIHVGDKITINIPDDYQRQEKDEIEETTENPFYCENFSITDTGVEVLYEDEDVLVVNKPPMLAMHPSHNHQGDTLANIVDAYLKSTNRTTAFRAVGRLDKGTSGVVICALNPYSANKLQGHIHKTYYAIPSGRYVGDGVVNLPIYRPDPMKTIRTVDERGVPAVTHWMALKSDDKMSLLEIWLETGRTHQIRVHFASLGTPLVGDSMYGPADEYICHQCLHCGKAVFYQPYSGEKIEIVAKMPSDMQEIADRIRSK